jgi:hypothetical protein
MKNNLFGGTPERHMRKYPKENIDTHENPGLDVEHLFVVRRFLQGASYWEDQPDPFKAEARNPKEFWEFRPVGPSVIVRGPVLAYNTEQVHRHSCQRY